MLSAHQYTFSPIKGCILEVKNPSTACTTWRRLSTNQVLPTKYSTTSRYVQNDMLAIMSNQILCDIGKEIQSAQFSPVMIDEATDLSNKQLVFTLRYVKEELFCS